MSEVEVLLIEDNLEDVEMIIRALKKNHFANDIKVIDDGFDALEYILGEGQYAGRNVHDQPKVILLDLKLPRVSGIEVLRKIKANENTRNVPVVVLTSSTEQPDLEECYKLGVNSYITKPVKFEDFVKVVADLGMYWLILNKVPGR